MSTYVTTYNLRFAMEQFERGYVRNIMVLARGDREQAAKMLGIHQEILATKLRQFNLDNRNAL